MLPLTMYPITITLASLAFGLAFRGLAILSNRHMPRFICSRRQE